MPFLRPTPLPSRYLRVMLVTAGASFTQCEIARAGVIPLEDALLLVQSWSMDASVVGITEALGPTITYNYTATDTLTGWAGTLTGGTIALSYAGDTSLYLTMGTIAWTASGTADGQTYSEVGSSEFVPVAGGTAFTVTTTATEGTTPLSLTLTGLADLDGSGQVSVADSSTDGTFAKDKLPKIKIDFEIKDGKTFFTFFRFRKVIDHIKRTEFSVTGDVVSPAIPESSTWAMMLVGFVGLCLAGYWRPRKHLFHGNGAPSNSLRG
jgi:hypothetical protein